MVWLQLGAPVESNTWTKALVAPAVVTPPAVVVDGVVLVPATATLPSVLTPRE